jgi:hypothetical protein
LSDELNGEPFTTGPAVVGEDFVMTVDLSELGETAASSVVRPSRCTSLELGLVVFGDGPGGGREASFDGPSTSYPIQAQPWNGYVVLQAKFKTKVDDPDWGAPAS